MDQVAKSEFLHREFISCEFTFGNIIIKEIRKKIRAFVRIHFKRLMTIQTKTLEKNVQVMYQIVIIFNIIFII